MAGNPPAGSQGALLSEAVCAGKAGGAYGCGSSHAGAGCIVTVCPPNGKRVKSKLFDIKFQLLGIFCTTLNHVKTQKRISPSTSQEFT